MVDLLLNVAPEYEPSAFMENEKMLYVLLLKALSNDLGGVALFAQARCKIAGMGIRD
jgi:hypothetical protein